MFEFAKDSSTHISPLSDSDSSKAVLKDKIVLFLPLPEHSPDILKAIQGNALTLPKPFYRLPNQILTNLIVKKG